MIWPSYPVEMILLYILHIINWKLQLINKVNETNRPTVCVSCGSCWQCLAGSAAVFQRPTWQLCRGWTWEAPQTFSQNPPLSGPCKWTTCWTSKAKSFPSLMGPSRGTISILPAEAASPWVIMDSKRTRWSLVDLCLQNLFWNGLTMSFISKYQFRHWLTILSNSNWWKQSGDNYLQLYYLCSVLGLVCLVGKMSLIH